MALNFCAGLFNLFNKFQSMILNFAAAKAVCVFDGVTARLKSVP
jgi:hypothetical protein